MTTTSPSYSSSSDPGAGYLRHPTGLIDPAIVRYGTPLIVARFPSGTEFLRAISIDSSMALRIKISTRTALRVGSEVVLEIMWEGLPNRVYARAFVTGRSRRGKLVAEFHADEHPTLDFLSRMAAGTEEMCAHRRKHPRYCVRLPVAWRPFGVLRMRTGIAEDLSSGGLRISTRYASVTVGERVVVRLRADVALQELVLTGIVKHRLEQQGGKRTMLGVELCNISGGEQRILRRLLRAFAANGAVLFDPDL